MIWRIFSGLLITIIVTTIVACSTSTEGGIDSSVSDSAERSELGAFRFLPMDGDHDCDECTSQVIGMCRVLKHSQAVVIARVKKAQFVRESCEERRYSLNHYDLTVEVMGVVEGIEVEGELDVVIVTGDNEAIGAKPGDVSIMAIRKVSGVWFQSYIVPIELVEDSVAPQDGEEGFQAIIFDLPTRFDDLRDDAQATARDYETACDQERTPRTDAELHASLFEKDCDSASTPEYDESGGTPGEELDDDL
ncbi:MAG: hypothetical protein ACNA8W_07870 [Bradymonadaceae bacterium]